MVFRNSTLLYNSSRCRQPSPCTSNLRRRRRRSHLTTPPKLLHPHRIIKLAKHTLNNPPLDPLPLQHALLGHIQDINPLGTPSLVPPDRGLPTERHDAVARRLAGHGVDAQDLEADGGLGALAGNEGVAVGEGDAVEGLARQEVDRGGGVGEVGSVEEFVGVVGGEGGEEGADWRGEGLVWRVSWGRGDMGKHTAVNEGGGGVFAEVTPWSGWEAWRSSGSECDDAGECCDGGLHVVGEE